MNKHTKYLTDFKLLSVDQFIYKYCQPGFKAQTFWWDEKKSFQIAMGESKKFSELVNRMTLYHDSSDTSPNTMGIIVHHEKHSSSTHSTTRLKARYPRPFSIIAHHITNEYFKSTK